MPTFTTIALHSLIEPKASKSMAAGKNGSDSKQGNQVNDTDKQPDSNNSTETKERKHHWTQISPALYATPDPTPLPLIPDSPSSFTPSPYIVNHKGRGPRLLKTFSEKDAALLDAKTSETIDEKINGTDDIDISNDPAVEQDNSISNPNLEQDNETDDFFDPQDSLSVRSSTDGVNTSASEFYDAWEELSSEIGSQSSRSDFETELREMKLSLLVEMEKRKQAEEKINDMKNQWGRIREQLSLVGLNLTNLEEDQSADDLSNQVHVIRFVSDSIGRGIGKAEVEAEMELLLDSKNFEIARLLDRLKYYEAVNREMSQRNQESMETMRSVRQRRKRRQKWIWGSIVAVVTVGSAALVWSNVSIEKGSISTDSDSSRK
ncbi:hypothetical protein Lser_V15G07247 [Lactuca serriola]